VVGFPAVFYFVCVVYKKVSVNVAVRIFFDCFKFDFLVDIDQMGVSALLAAQVFEINLRLDISFLNFMVHFDGLSENIVTLLHWEPLKAGHKLVNELVDLVAVADAANVDLDVIFSYQALWVKIEILNVQGALTFTSPGTRPVFWECLVIKVSLTETFASLHRLL
jgi:hypothetical protein